MKKMTTTAHLAYWLGFLGIHRFYTGYKLIGVIQLLTLGGCLIWYFIDNFSIVLNKYKDADGNQLTDFNKKVANVYLVLLIMGIVSGLVSVIIDD